MPSPLLHVRLDLDLPIFSKSLAVYYGKGGNCLKSGLYMFSGQNIDFAYVSDSLQQFKKFYLSDLSDLFLTFNHTGVKCQIIDYCLYIMSSNHYPDYAYCLQALSLSKMENLKRLRWDEMIDDEDKWLSGAVSSYLI